MCEVQDKIYALLQDYSISIANAQSGTKLSIYTRWYPTLLFRLWIYVIFPHICMNYEKYFCF